MKNMSQSTDPQFPPHENTPLITTAQPGSAYLLESITGEEISSNLKPLDKINGYDVRPGFYEVNGASALPGGVNFRAIHKYSFSGTLPDRQCFFHDRLWSEN